jgi:hypothetical protein
MNFAPVTLNHLSTLGLEHIEPQGLCLLLPLLAPIPALDVKLAAYTRDPGEVGEALTDFFARAKVEKLHLSTFVNPAQLPRMLARLRGLKSLIWQGLNMENEFFEAMSRADIPSTTPSSSNNAQGEGDRTGAETFVCPNLESLELQQCSLSGAAVRDMVTARMLPRLVIAGCYLSVDGTGEEAPKLMEEIEKSLTDAVPNLLLSENSLVVQD